MPSEHPPIYYVLQSRKFWSAVVGFAAIIIVSLRSGSALDPNTVVNAILGIVAAYMGATAWEDSATKNADATMHAANVTAASQSATTTVTTPSENVTVSTSDTATPTAPKPRVETIGLV